MQVNVVGCEVVRLCQPVTLPVSTLSGPRRLKYSATLLWEPQILLCRVCSNYECCSVLIGLCNENNMKVLENIVYRGWWGTRVLTSYIL